MMENITLDLGFPDNITGYTNSKLTRFSRSYASIHGYVSLCVCVFGIVTNLFNVSVLTRKHMKTPVNQILTWLAISDILTMISYIPFAIHFYCQYPQHTSEIHERNSHGWMSFLVFHINLASTTHTISIWMCVTLAIVRYLHIKNPTKTNVFRIRRIYQTRIIIIIVYISSTVILIPNYLSNEIHETVLNNKTIYFLEDLKLGRAETEATVLINVWMYAMIAKLIPCLLMSIFGGLLIYNIHVKIRQRRKVLQISGNNHARLSEHSRTTKMLVTVIILFIVTEFPQGVLIVCSACVENFFDTVYLPLGDVMDIMALVNNAINFVLYCTMSTKFRQTFFSLYCGRCKVTRTSTDNFVSLTEKRRFDSNSNNNMLLPALPP
ncbi:G-protein coupled receptor [Mactra antiquata]